MKIGLLGGISTVIALASYAQTVERADSQEINGSIIHYHHLSNEEIEPYLSRGFTLDEWEQKRSKDSRIRSHKQHRKAVNRFPDVRSCLKPSEAEIAVPRMMNFDWDQLDNIVEMEVCLYRVFVSINDIELTRNWIELQGFGRDRLYYRYQLVNGEKASQVDKTILRGIWSMENRSSPIGNGTFSFLKESWLKVIKANSLAISVTYTAEESIENIQVLYNIN